MCWLEAGLKVAPCWVFEACASAVADAALRTLWASGFSSRELAEGQRAWCSGMCSLRKIGFGRTAGGEVSHSHYKTCTDEQMALTVVLIQPAASSC